MLTKKRKRMEESKTKNKTYDPDWLQGMNGRDNFEAHYKKVTIALHSNCLAVAVKGKEVANEQPNLSKVVIRGTEHSTVPQASGPAPTKRDAQKFLPHHSHSALTLFTNCRGSSTPCVHQGKGKNSTMAFAAKRAACADSPTATPDTKSQKESTSQKVGGGHPGHSGHLHFLEKSCYNMKTDHAAIPETPLVLSIPRGMPEAHHTTVRCGNRWDIPNLIAYTKS